jgi:hypothetical protein
LNIPEHGANPWLSRNCNGEAFHLAKAGHCCDASRWEGGERPTTRKPVDLFNPRRKRNLMAKDSDGQDLFVGVLFLLVFFRKAVA